MITGRAHVLDPEELGDHVDRLFRAAWALCGSREDAEDLVQETFTRVLARPRILRHDNHIHYLMRTLRNTFLSGRRAAARRPRSAEIDAETLDLRDSRTSGEPAAAAESREVFAAISALAPSYRDVLVAIDITGLSYRETAKVLRLREQTVATRLFRARGQVARALSVDDPEIRRSPAGAELTRERRQAPAAESRCAPPCPARA